MLFTLNQRHLYLSKVLKRAVAIGRVRGQYRIAPSAQYLYL